MPDPTGSNSNNVQQKILQPPSSELPIKDKEPLKEPVRKQTDSGDNTQQNSQSLDQRGIENTEAASHVNAKAAEIRSLEEHYVSHCNRLADLEGKREITLRLKDIADYIRNPDVFDPNCGFEIKYVSKSGTVEILLPPQEGMSKERQKKLLMAMAPKIKKIEETFVSNGRDQELDEAINAESIEADEAHKQLEAKAPDSKVLNYTPQKRLQYELTADLPDWPPTEGKETGKFVIEVKPTNNNHQPNQSETSATTPRAILKPDTTPEEELISEPDIFELPGIKNIRPLRSDAPLFLPRGDNSQEATATIISGDADSEFALPKALTSTFEDEDGGKFQALHSTLRNRVKDTGVMPDADLRKIAPACIRQCFCDKTGSMGTTFIHVFAENHTQSPYSSENRHNKVMVLWYPNKGLQITPDSLQQANMEVMRALNKYQRKAFSYNDRPLDEEGPGLERDFATYSQSKRQTESAENASLIANTRTGKKRKLKTKDPREPSAYPVITALRVRELPHEALLKRSPTTEEDNQALQGFRSALKDLPENRRFLKSLELPERFVPKEESSKPALSNTDTLPNQRPTESVSSPLLDEDEEYDLNAVLEKELKQSSLTSPLSNGLTADRDTTSLNEEDDLAMVIEQEQATQSRTTTSSSEPTTDKVTAPLPEQDMAKLQEQDDNLRTQDNREFSEVKTEAPEETVKPDISGQPKTQAQKNLEERRDTLQLFDEPTTQSILHLGKSSLQSDGPRTDIQPPVHTTTLDREIIPREEGSNDVAKFRLYVESSISNSESVQPSTSQFSGRVKDFLAQHIEKKGSLDGISDSQVINIIYSALLSPGESLLDQTADFRIFLGINNSYWIVNRRDSGDMRTLCIPHKNPEIREIHADNTDQTIAENLAKAIYKTDHVKEELLTKTKGLPAISKLPPFENDGYYLLMERTALNELMPEQEILQFIKNRHGQEPNVIRDELKEELTARWGKKQGSQYQEVFDVFNLAPS